MIFSKQSHSFAESKKMPVDITAALSRTPIMCILKQSPKNMGNKLLDTINFQTKQAWIIFIKVQSNAVSFTNLVPLILTFRWVQILKCAQKKKCTSGTYLCNINFLYHFRFYFTLQKNECNSKIIAYLPNLAHFIRKLILQSNHLILDMNHPSQ